MHVVSILKYRCKYCYTNRQDRRYSNVTDIHRNLNSSSLVGCRAVRTGCIPYRRASCFQVSISAYTFRT